MDIKRILEKLDSYFSKNDYFGAERHLNYWLNEAEQSGDDRSKLTLCNELIGLSRKLSNEEQTFKYTRLALDTLKSLQMEDSISAATTYINVATAYKAFGKPSSSLPLFEKAKIIYESNLLDSDSRLGGLYNNMALTLSELKRFEEAYFFYNRAISVMSSVQKGELEIAITHLNIASTAEAEKGLVDADEEIQSRLQKASALLDIYKNDTDGYYAFVCEKCASVFGYYGHFLYEKELKERAKNIYERS